MKSGNQKTISVVIGVVFAILAFFAVQQFFKSPTLNKDLIELANEMNKTLPRMGDSETRMDNTAAHPNNTFRYTYTLVNIDKESIDIIGFKKLLEPHIINELKANPQMQWQRDNKVTLDYYYKDKNGIHLFTITVKPEQY